jgi:hypothetical protein
MLADMIPLREKYNRAVTCPRSAGDVYSFGLVLYDYLTRNYTDLANQIKDQNRFLDLTARYNRQKKDVNELINNDLNHSLACFYETGGAVIEPPVSQLDLKDIQPFFNKTLANFYSQLDAMLYVMGKGKMTVAELEEETHNYVVGLFTILRRFYQAPEVRQAFNELIQIEISSREHS